MSVRRVVSVVTPPAGDPVTLAEAKAWVKVDITDDDTLITALITAATQSAELYTRRSLVTRTLKLSIDPPCYGWANSLPEGTYDLPISALTGDLPTTIQLPSGPVQSIASVITYDINDSATTMDAGGYRVDTASGRFTLTFGIIWPTNLRQIAACEITYLAGYGNASAVPLAIKTAIMMHVQTMYDGRTVCDMPDSCKQLLNQYRIYGDGMR